MCFTEEVALPAHFFEYIRKGSQGSCHIGAFCTVCLLPDMQSPPA